MEAFTFAVSTQVDFPIHVKMYVWINARPAPNPGNRKLTGSKWLVGRKAEADPTFSPIQATGPATHRFHPEPNVRSVCDGSTMVRFQATGCTHANFVQDFQVR